jgi:hypothetical protein
MRLVHAAILQTHPVPDLCLTAANSYRIRLRLCRPSRSYMRSIQAWQGKTLCFAPPRLGFGLHKRALCTKGERLSSGSRTLINHPTRLPEPFGLELFGPGLGFGLGSSWYILQTLPTLDISDTSSCPYTRYYTIAPTTPQITMHVYVRGASLRVPAVA